MEQNTVVPPTSKKKDFLKVFFGLLIFGVLMGTIDTVLEQVFGINIRKGDWGIKAALSTVILIIFVYAMGRRSAGQKTFLDKPSLFYNIFASVALVLLLVLIAVFLFNL